MSNYLFEKYQLQDGDSQAYQSLYDLQQTGNYMGFNVKSMNAEQLELFGKFLEKYYQAGPNPVSLFYEGYESEE